MLPCCNTVFHRDFLMNHHYTIYQFLKMPPKQKTAIPSVDSSALLRDLEGMEIGSSQMSGLESFNAQMQANQISNRSSDDEQKPPTQRLAQQRTMSNPVPRGMQNRTELDEFVPDMILTPVRRREQKSNLKSLRGTGAAAKRIMDVIKTEVGKHFGVTYSASSFNSDVMRGEGAKDDLDEVQVKAEFEMFRKEAELSQRVKGAPAGSVLAAHLWPPMSCWKELQSRTLKAALYSSVTRGCKVCTGFGHSSAKCITTLRLKNFGKGIKIIREAYKEALKLIPTNASVTTDGYWLLIPTITQQFDAAIKFAKKDARPGATDRQTRLEYYRGYCSDTLHAISTKRCHTCHGWGHITSDELRHDMTKKKKDGQMIPDEQAIRDSTQMKKKMYCPTVVEIDTKINYDPLALQEWIRVKHDIIEAATTAMNAALYGQQTQTTVTYKCESLKGSNGAQISAKDWWTSYIQTVITGWAFKGFEHEIANKMSYSSQYGTATVPDEQQMLRKELGNIVVDLQDHLDELKGLHTDGKVQAKIEDLAAAKTEIQSLATSDMLIAGTDLRLSKIIQTMKERVQEYLQSKPEYAETYKGILKELTVDTPTEKSPINRLIEHLKQLKQPLLAQWQAWESWVANNPADIVIDQPFEPENEQDQKKQRQKEKDKKEAEKKLQIQRDKDRFFPITEAMDES